MARMARPKVIGQMLLLRPQLIAQSSDVTIRPSSKRFSIQLMPNLLSAAYPNPQHKPVHPEKKCGHSHRADQPAGKTPLLHCRGSDRNSDRLLIVAVLPLFALQTVFLRSRRPHPIQVSRFHSYKKGIAINAKNTKNAQKAGAPIFFNTTAQGHSSAPPRRRQ